MKSIRSKILLGILPLAALVFLVTIGMVSWKLTTLLSAKSDALVRDFTQKSLQSIENGHAFLLSRLADNASEVQKFTAGLGSDPTLGRAFEFGDLPLLKKILREDCQAHVIDFAFVFTRDGSLQAAFPADAQAEAAHQLFARLPSAGAPPHNAAGHAAILPLPTGLGGGAETHDNGALLAQAFLAPLADTLGQPTGFVLAGRILNDDAALLAPVAHFFGTDVMLSSGTTLVAWQKTKERAANGHDQQQRTLSQEALTGIAAANAPLNTTVTIGGAPHFASCSALRAPDGTLLGAACTALPRQEVEAQTTAIRQEGHQAVRDTRNWITVFSAIAFLLLTGSIALLTSIVIRPILDISVMIRDVVEGRVDLSKRLTVTSSDEAGAMAGHVNLFLDKFQSVMAKVATHSEQLAYAAQQLSTISDGITTTTRRVDEQTASAVTATEQISARLSSAASTSGDMTENANAASLAAEEMASNVNAVAASVEELSISIGDVAQSCNQASTLATIALNNCEASDTTMTELTHEAEAINQIISVITEIADQVKLLALNATIEAARAGEAGRGFAVVASEVKDLARQTAGATDKIATQIGKIQEKTAHVVSALGAIKDATQNVTMETATIAATIEQQAEATGTIARTVTETAHGAKVVSGTIRELSAGLERMVEETIGSSVHSAKEVSATVRSAQEAVSDATSGTEMMHFAAKELAAEAEALQQQISELLNFKK